MLYRIIGFPAVASKKNRRRWIRRGRKKFLVPSSEATADESSLHEAAVRSLPAGTIPFPDDDVELTIVYHARSGKVDIGCRSIGPRPKGFTGRRRDAHGMIETIADALQDAFYRNDNQVARLVIERHLD